MWISFFAIAIAVAICLSVAAFIMQSVTHQSKNI
jgi:MFS superfamily sulfate permease-like transporter